MLRIPRYGSESPDEHVREVLVWVHPGFSVQLRMTPDYRELLESTAEFLDLMKKTRECALAVLYFPSEQSIQEYEEGKNGPDYQEWTGIVKNLRKEFEDRCATVFSAYNAGDAEIVLDVQRQLAAKGISLDEESAIGVLGETALACVPIVAETFRKTLRSKNRPTVHLEYTTARNSDQWGIHDAKYRHVQTLYPEVYFKPLKEST